MDKAEEFLRRFIETGKSPSVQYFLFDKEKVLRHLTFGKADIESNREANSNTVYHAFSTTKTFTALSVLILAQQGKLRIDEPVSTYLRGFGYNSKMTIRHLLTHSSGLPNPVPLKWIHLQEEHAGFNQRKFVNSVLARHNKTLFAPNKRFAYSNLGYLVLGQLVETVSNQSYEEFVQAIITHRLGIESSELGFNISNSMHIATGYQKKATFSSFILGFLIDKSKFLGPSHGKWQPFRPFYVNGAAYGGLVGTARAFVTYVQALLRNDSVLISPEYKDFLFRENSLDNGKLSGMCCSWFPGSLNGISYRCHAGGGGGYYCEIRIYPNSNRGSVVFLNRTGMSDERLLDKIDTLNRLEFGAGALL